MSDAFAPIVRARPDPTFGRPVRHGVAPHRLRPGTTPHALRIPPHGGHPALRVTRGGSRSPLAVSGFRLRARVGFSIPSSPRPARNYPRFRIRRPSSGRRRDLNPPDHHAAQRTLRRLRPHRQPSLDSKELAGPLPAGDCLWVPVFRWTTREPGRRLAIPLGVLATSHDEGLVAASWKRRPQSGSTSRTESHTWPLPGRIRG
jgi:hypothetical protein